MAVLQDNKENSINTKENKMKNNKEMIRSNKGKCVMIVAIVAVMLVSLLTRTGFGNRAWSYFRKSNVRSLEEPRIS